MENLCSCNAYYFHGRRPQHSCVSSVPLAFLVCLYTLALYNFVYVLQIHGSEQHGNMYDGAYDAWDQGER